MNYQNLLQEVLQLVDQNPNKKWKLEDVAAHFGYSSYHFHRIFKAVSNETFHQFITNRRLSYSTEELMLSSRRIIDIAFSYHFSSHESYSRAFKRNFHVNPSTFKDSSDAYTFFEQNFLLPHSSSHRDEPKLHYLPSFSFNELTSTKDKGKAIGELWAEALAHSKVPNTNQLVGILTSNPYRYGAGIKGNSPDSTIIPKQMYATMYHYGTYNTIKQTYQFIDQWLTEQQITALDGPELEIYRPRQLVEICIPVEWEDEKLSN